MKKLLCMILALVMLLSLAACGQGGAASGHSSGDASEPVSETGEEGADTETSGGQENTDNDFSERLTLTIGMSAPFTEENFDFTAGSEFHKYISDMFNIDVEVIAQARDSANEQITTWINAQDLPDLTVWEYNTVELTNYVNQELLLKWPDDWREKYPNLAKAHDLTPANTYYDEQFGGVYIHSVPLFADHFPAETITNHLTLWVRKDYVEKAGYDLSKTEESLTMTLSELTNLMQTVKDSGVVEYPMYLDPSGVDHYMEMTSSYNGLSVTNPAFYVSGDGKYHWGPAEEETNIRQTVKAIHDQYQAGLIDQDFYSSSSGSAAERLFTSGESALVTTVGTMNMVKGWAQDTEDNLGIDFFENYMGVVLTDDAGYAHNGADPNYWRGLIINPDIEQNKLDRLMALLDYLASEEGNAVSNLGIPGVDWDYGENGEYVSLLPEGETAADKYTQLYPWCYLVIGADDFYYVNPTMPENIRDFVSNLYIKRSDVTDSKDKEVDWFIRGYTSPAMTQASLIYVDEYTNLIIADGDFDTNYDNWIQEKMSLIQPVLDELNADR